MPPYPMMFQGGSPDETQTGDPVSEQEALVRRLLSSLEPNVTPPPPQLSNSRRLLGPLGDALMAMASVRAGGAPPQMGAFAAEQEKRRAAYEQRLTENARADRALRNSVRVGVMQGMVRRRNQIRLINTKDEAGNPITVPMEYDPSDGSLRPLETTTGQGSFGRYVPPVIMPGMVNEAGQPPKARILKIPRGGGPTTVVPGPGGTTLEPQPPPGLATEAGGRMGVLERIPDVMAVFNQAANAVGGSEGKLHQLENWVKAKAGATSIGPIVAPPELVNYYSSVKSVLFPIVKAGSGMVFPEAELKRWEARFPIPGVDPPDVAEHKWNVLIGEIVSDVRAKYGAVGRTPPIQGPGGGSPNTRSWSGVVLHESDFANAKPGERERFLAGGGRIAP